MPTGIAGDFAGGHPPGRASGLLALRANDLLRLPLEGGMRGTRAWVREALAGLEGGVLDVACGTGLLRGAVGARPYLGIDADAGALALARRRGLPGDRYELGDARALASLEDGGWDAVLCHGLLHHLDAPDAARTLAELARVARGPVLLADPITDGAPPHRRLLYALDRGRWIRSSDEIEGMVARAFVVERRWRFRSGLNLKLGLRLRAR